MSNNKNTVYTCVASREVKYSFTCEKCGRDSGLILGVLHGEASRSLSYRDRLTDDQLAPLCESARHILNKRIENPCILLNDKCPNCGSIQPWGEPKRRLEILARFSIALGISNVLLWIILLKKFSNIEVLFSPLVMILEIGVVLYGPVVALEPFRQRIMKQCAKNSGPMVLWDTLKDTEYSITVTDTDSWGVKKEYPVNIHEENSKETEVKQKCQD